MRATSPDLSPPTPDDELSYINENITRSRVVYEANQVLKGVKKRAKNLRVDTKAADFAEACRKKGDKGRAHAEAVARCLFLTGVIDRSFLVNLVETNETASEGVLLERRRVVARDEGWVDGHDGIPQEDSRYPAGSEEATAWAEGHHGGASSKQLVLGLEGKAASAHKELPAGRRERKIISVVTDQSNGNGSVLPNVKKRGRPPGVKNKPKPVVEDAAMQAA